MKRSIINPVFKDVVTFIKTSAETNGQYSEIEVLLNPQGGNPMHKHTAFTETFMPLEGTLGLTVNGEKISLNPGQKFTVQKGDAHQFFNAGEEPITFKLIFQPGHTGAENMLRILYGMAEDGLADKTGIPKSITAIAVIGELGNSALTGVMSLLTPLLKIMAIVGRRKGVDKILIEKYCN